MDPENIPFETGDLPPELSDFFIQAYKAIAKDPSLVRKIQGIFQFRIKNSSDWIIDLKSGTGAVTRGVVKKPDVTLRYNSAKAFLDINSGKLGITRAIMTGKFKISGNMKLLQKMQKVMAEAKRNESAAAADAAAQAQAAATPGTQGSSTPGPNGGVVRVNPRWIMDKEVTKCMKCSNSFNFLRRKHHCRYCGGIFCATCSSNRFQKKRVCDYCYRGLTTATVSESPALRRSQINNTVYVRTLTPSETSLRAPSAMRARPGASSGAEPSRLTAGGKFQRSIITPLRGRVNASHETKAGEPRAELPPQEAESPQFEVDEEEQEEAEKEYRAMVARVRELEAKIGNMETELLISATPQAQPPSFTSLLLEYGAFASLFYPLFMLAYKLGHSLLLVLFVWWTLTSFWGGSAFMGIIWGLCAVGVWLVSNSQSEYMALLRRRLTVYAGAIALFCDYKLVQWQGKSLDPGDYKGVLEVTHRRNASRLYRLLLGLRGMWVKMGQYLSSRPDTMPKPYIQTLGRLQDALPPRPFAEVKKSIEDDLGKKLDEVFGSFDPEALAAASIAQVHRATLKDGTPVAVKVQHSDMSRLLSQDLDNLNHLLSWMALLEPGFDLKGVLEEWSKEMMKELDFHHEAENLQAVRENMLKGRLPVTVPRVVREVSGTRVLVMRFINGIKITDPVELDKLGVDRDKLVADICTAYAHQIYRDGLFNGDPHPGNIMAIREKDLFEDDPKEQEALVQQREAFEKEKQFAMERGQEVPSPVPHTGSGNSWVPVLLDFGLTKKLSESMRLAFAKLVISAEEMDYGGILEAFDAMGMVFTSESVAEDMENLRHMFRDAVPVEEARKRSEERHQKMKEKRERDQQNKKEGKEVRKVVAWPSDLVFFMRSSELLQGVCTQLETRHSFMKTMSNAAREAMRDRVPIAERADTCCFPPHFHTHIPEEFSSLKALGAERESLVAVKYQPPAPPKDSSSTKLLMPIAAVTALESTVRQMLLAKRKEDVFEGIQISVFQGGVKRTEVAAGRMGSLDPRPVTPASMFPLLGLSRIGVVAIVHWLRSEGKVQPSTPLSDIWPAFKPIEERLAQRFQEEEGAEKPPTPITVADLLCGRSGLEPLVPEKITTTKLTRDHWDDMLSALLEEDCVADARLLPSVLSAQRKRMETGFQVAVTEEGRKYLHESGKLKTLLGVEAGQEQLTHLWFGWGWGAGAALQAAAGNSLVEELLSQKVGAVAGVQGELLFGCSEQAIAFPSPLATLSIGQPGDEVNDDEELGSAGEETKGSEDKLLPAVAEESEQESEQEEKGTESTEVNSTTLSADSRNSPSPSRLRKPRRSGSPTSLRSRQLSTGSIRPIGRSSPGITRGDSVPEVRRIRIGGDTSSTTSGSGTKEEPASTTASRSDSGSVVSESTANGDGGEALEGDTGNMASAMAAVQLLTAMGDAGLEELSELSSGGKEHFMDPRLLNARQLRTSCLPSFNMLASARGLGGLGAWLLRGLRGGMGELSVAEANTIALRACAEYGFRPVMIKPRGGDKVRLGFAMGALGGSIAVFDPLHDLVVTLLVNKLTPTRDHVEGMLNVIWEKLEYGSIEDLFFVEED